MLAAFAVMLAYHRLTTLFALALLPLVVADAGAPAYLALTDRLLWQLCSHICDPPHSLHLVF